MSLPPGILRMASIDDDDPVAVFAAVVKHVGPFLAQAGLSAASSATGAGDDLTLLDAKAVGALLGVDAGEVYRLARVGELGYFGKGRARRFTRAQVREYIEKRSVGARR